MIKRLCIGILILILFVTPVFTASAEISKQKEFSLLYSIAGYSLHGTKRALLRQLIDCTSTSPGTWKVYKIGEATELIELRAACENMFDSEYLQWIDDLCGKPTARGCFTEEPETFHVTVYSCDFSSISEEGTYILTAELQDNSLLASKPFCITHAPLGNDLLPALSIHAACARFATNTMFGGFYDCNTKYGEAYSHGTYLNGLSNYYLYSNDNMDDESKENLHWSASVAFDYLMKIRKADTGEIRYKAPERPGDAALNSGIHNSIEAVCGLSAYMDAFASVDSSRVNETNYELILQTIDYIDSELKSNSQGNGAEWKTAVFCHLYRVQPREDILERAWAAAMQTIEALDWEHNNRSRIMSPFEGLWLLTQIDPTFSENELLVEKIAIWKNDIQQILKLSAYDFPTFNGSWGTMHRLSLSEFYSNHGFYWSLNVNVLCQVLDACFLWQLTDDDSFERMASGALYYVTGLNFGLPADMCTEVTASNESISCASFVANNYGGVLPWDLWTFKMQDDQWASIVNGYTYDNGSYTYTNSDWQHGETFIRTDGLMLFAGSLYEMLVNANYRE